MVIEFKHVKGSKATKKSVATAAAAALKQVEGKGYAKELKAEGYKDVYVYGIAFSGKYCVVEAAFSRGGDKRADSGFNL